MTCSIAVLGPASSISMQVARRLYPKGNFIVCDSFVGVTNAVRQQQAHLGVLPWRNVLIGPIQSAQQAYAAHDQQLTIQQQLWHHFELAMATSQAEQPIQAIYSKQEAIDQCSQYLQTHFPHIALHAASSTGAAMMMLKSAPTKPLAAIVDYSIIAENGLHCYARNIANSTDNKTLFVVIQNITSAASSQTHSNHLEP